MRGFLAALTLVAVPLSAADQAKAADVEQSASVDWSGPYIGVDAGYLSSDLHWQNIEVNDHLFPYEPRGFLGSVHAGYNHQFESNIVLGVETSLKFGDLAGEETHSVLFGAVDPGWRGTGGIEWAADLRAKLGFSLGNLMPYVTGGVAASRVNYDIELLGITAYDNSKTLTGWTAGGGVEWAINESLSVRAQYLFADYEPFSEDPDTPGGGLAAYKLDMKTHEATVGLSLRF